MMRSRGLLENGCDRRGRQSARQDQLAAAPVFGDKAGLLLPLNRVRDVVRNRREVQHAELLKGADHIHRADDPRQLHRSQLRTVLGCRRRPVRHQ